MSRTTTRSYNPLEVDYMESLKTEKRFAMKNNFFNGRQLIDLKYR